MPTFIFGIVSWNCGEMSFFFHAEPRAGNKKVKGNANLEVLKLYKTYLVCPGG